MLLSSSYDELKSLVKDKKIPMVICDLDVFEQNLERVGDHLREAKKTLRLCTKSVRVPELIKKVMEKDFVNGIFAYNSSEVLFLAEKYRFKDILMGYPISSPVDAQELCKAASIDGVEVTVMIDSIFHLNLLEAAAAKNNVELKILIDVDVADHFFGRNVGVYRSPLRDPMDVVKMARETEKRPHLKYKGIMGYEAQNASLGDVSAFMRWIKKRSRKHVNIWRQNVVDALSAEGYKPEVVNGGGSGCHQDTAAESSITELGIGSLLFKSHIFDPIDALRDFKPSLFFILQIVRKPRKNIVTAFSGGYVSSGVRALPIPVVPENLKTSKDENFGEVQTPFFFDPAKINLDIGDPILCRFGKAGEPLEHFNEIQVYRDGKIFDKYLTYRGFGQKFY